MYSKASRAALSLTQKGYLRVNSKAGRVGTLTSGTTLVTPKAPRATILATLTSAPTMGTLTVAPLVDY